MTSAPTTASAATSKVLGVKKTFTVSGTKVTGLSKAEKKVVKVSIKKKKVTVKGLKAGKVSFKIGKKSYNVTVVKTTIKNHGKITLTEGQSKAVNFTVKNGAKDTIKFSSSDKAIAKVSSKATATTKAKATVKAIKEGTATITAKSVATGKKATMKVTVVKAAEATATATPAAGEVTATPTAGEVTATPEAGQTTEVPTGPAVTATPVATTATAITEAKVVGAKKIQIKFDGAVDTTKAQFVVNRGASVLNVESNPTWSDDKTTVTLTLASNVVTAEYTIKVSGVAAEAITTKISAEAAVVSEIKVLSEKAVLTKKNKGPVRVKYGVYNQYNEDVTSSCPVTVVGNVTTNGAITASNGKFVSETDTFDTVVNKFASFSITYQSGTVYVTKTATLEVADPAYAAEVKVVGVYNKDNKTLSEANKEDDFYLEIKVIDQYGDEMEADKVDTNTLSASDSDSLVVETAKKLGTTDPDVVEIPQTTDTKTKRYGIKLNVKKAGKSVVYLHCANGGKTTTYELNVTEGTRAYGATVGTPTQAIAGEAMFIPIEVTDKEGKPISNTSVLHGTYGVKVTYNNGVDNANTVYTITSVKGVTGIQVPKEEVVAGPHIVTVQFKEQAIAPVNATIQVNAQAYPVAIAGLRDFNPAEHVEKETATLSLKNVVFEDQYGRTISSEKNKEPYLYALVTGSAVNGANFKVTVEDNDNGTDGAIEVSTDKLTEAGTTITLRKVGAETIKLTLIKTVNSLVSTSSTYEFTYTVADDTSFKSYETTDLGTMYVSTTDTGANLKDQSIYSIPAAYAKNIEVKGILSNGAKVKLNKSKYSIASSVGAFQNDAADSSVDSFTFERSKLKGADGKYADEYAVNYQITINSNSKVIDKKVKFSTVAPKASSMEVKKDDVEISTVKISKFNYPNGLGWKELIAEAEATQTVKDQYGKAAAISTNASGSAVYTFANGDVAGYTVSVKSVAGTVATVNNGTMDARITAASKDAAAEVTFTSGSVTYKLNVTFENKMLQAAVLNSTTANGYTGVTYVSSTKTLTVNPAQFVYSAVEVSGDDIERVVIDGTNVSNPTLKNVVLNAKNAHVEITAIDLDVINVENVGGNSLVLNNVKVASLDIADADGCKIEAKGENTVIDTLTIKAEITDTTKAIVLDGIKADTPIKLEKKTAFKSTTVLTKVQATTVAAQATVGEVVDKNDDGTYTTNDTKTNELVIKDEKGADVVTGGAIKTEFAVTKIDSVGGNAKITGAATVVVTGAATIVLDANANITATCASISADKVNVSGKTITLDAGITDGDYTFAISPNADGYKDETAQTITVKVVTTKPTISSMQVNAAGTKITITLDRGMQTTANDEALKAAFTISVAGNKSGVSISSTDSKVIEIAGSDFSSSTKVAYAETGLLTDEYGNPLAAMGATVVTGKDGE